MTGFRFYELALAAAFGFCTALIVAWLKGARDDHLEVFKQFAEQVGKIADLGTDYWLSSNDETARQKLEAKIVGGQTSLQHHLVLLAQRLRPHEIMPLSLGLARLLDALSGGDFGRPQRETDARRAKDCQVRAAELAATVRKTYGDTVGLQPMFIRFIRWPHVD